MLRSNFRIIVLATALGVCFLSFAAEQPPIMPNGWGVVTVGMTLAEAEAALGEPLVDTDPGLDGCFYVEPISRPGVEFMVFVDVIARIESTNAAVGASRGIRLGDSISAVIAEFGEAVNIGPNHYLKGWRDVFIGDASRKYALLFEVNDKDRVVGIRGGDIRYVGMVERCA